MIYKFIYSWMTKWGKNKSYDMLSVFRKDFFRLIMVLLSDLIERMAELEKCSKRWLEILHRETLKMHIDLNLKFED